MGTIHCYFCGGKACKYELYENWLDVENSHNAIVGLYSNWITDNILATARPSTRIIKQYGVIEQFHTHNIGAIINLQQPGEHRDCGDGIIDNGFSYLPEDFMNQNTKVHHHLPPLIEHTVFYYNFGWEDLKAPAFDLALNIVQVISFTLSQGKKVAIHCHAGLGRTGLVIACYLVFSKQFSARGAVDQVRLHRNMSIQNARQEGFVMKFEQALNKLRVVYHAKSGSKPSTLATVLRRQRRYLHGLEERTLRYVPKVVCVVCERLCKVVGVGGSCGEREPSNEELAHVVSLEQSINGDEWNLVEEETCDVVLLQLLVDFFSLLKQPILNEEAISLIKSFPSFPSLPSLQSSPSLNLKSSSPLKRGWLSQSGPQISLTSLLPTIESVKSLSFSEGVQIPPPSSPPTHSPLMIDTSSPSFPIISSPPPTSTPTSPTMTSIPLAPITIIPPSTPPTTLSPLLPTTPLPPIPTTTALPSVSIPTLPTTAAPLPIPTETTAPSLLSDSTAPSLLSDPTAPPATTAPSSLSDPTSPPETATTTATTETVTSPTKSKPFFQTLREPTRSTLLCIVKMIQTISLCDHYYYKLGMVLLPGVPANTTVQFLQNL